MFIPTDALHMIVLMELAMMKDIIVMVWLYSIQLWTLTLAKDLSYGISVVIDKTNVTIN